MRTRSNSVGKFPTQRGLLPLFRGENRLLGEVQLQFRCSPITVTAVLIEQGVAMRCKKDGGEQGEKRHLADDHKVAHD